MESIKLPSVSAIARASFDSSRDPPVTCNIQHNRNHVPHKTTKEISNRFRIQFLSHMLYWLVHLRRGNAKTECIDFDPSLFNQKQSSFPINHKSVTNMNTNEGAEFSIYLLLVNPFAKCIYDLSI